MRVLEDAGGPVVLCRDRDVDVRLGLVDDHRVEVLRPGANEGITATGVGGDGDAVAASDRVELLDDGAGDEAHRQESGGLLDGNVLREADEVALRKDVRETGCLVGEAVGNAVAGCEAAGLGANRLDAADGLHAERAETESAHANANFTGARSGKK